MGRHRRYDREHMDILWLVYIFIAIVSVVLVLVGFVMLAKGIFNLAY